MVGDRRKVKQMLLNLLSNAIKFSEEGDDVHLEAAQSLNGEMMISVADTGIGMTREQIEIALSPFGQIDNSSVRRKYQGSGLGLPLTKAFVELHHGKMEIESAPGVGTKFTLIFPNASVIKESA